MIAFGTRVKQACHPLAWRLAPQQMSDRAYRYQLRLHDMSGHFALSEAFVEQYGDRVLHGPFTGMRYPPRRIMSLPKRLGLYEWQLQPWFEDILSASPQRCVNIGASDGYYAVGIARFGIAVDAFESSRLARSHTVELAELNRVEVRTFGPATGARLRSLNLEGALVISDCEGAEVQIFDQKTVDALRHATCLIECHEDEYEGATELLCERFRQSHTCDILTPATEIGQQHLVAAYSRAVQRAALDEKRNDRTPWILLRPMAA